LERSTVTSTVIYFSRMGNTEKVARAILRVKGYDHGCLSRSHGRNDGRFQAEDTRPSGRSRERRTFRPLIPLSEVDTIRTGNWEYTFHPQWIIGKGPQKGVGSDGES
jgi:hypothetical protein